MSTQTKLPIVVMNAGAGGVGKTSVVTEAKRLGDELGYRVAVMPSITREVYASLGIPTEGSALTMSLETQLKLQNAVMETYSKRVVEFVRNNSYAELILIDRSPYDYVAYFFHNLGMTISLAEALERQQEALNVIKTVLGMSDRLIIQYYKFPDFWHTTETESSDGFRSDKGGKNIMWDMILYSMLTRLKTSSTTPTLQVTEWPLDGMSVRDRALHLLGLLT